MGFDPDAYLEKKSQEPSKSGFDPDSYLKSKNVSMEPKISKTESGLRGAAQGATLGFADEISGSAEALWEMAKGNTEDFGRLYKQYRDESRSNFADAQEANPKTYLAGEVGGGLATTIMPAGVGLKAAQTAVGLGVRGAAAGAAAGLGYSNEDDVGGQLLDTGKGLALGAVLPVAIQKAGKGAQRLVNKGAEKFADAMIDSGLVSNADEVIAAADRIGVKPTPAMLSKSERMQRLEQSLSDSPSLFGKRVHNQRSKVFSALQNKTDEVLSDASTDTPYQIGEEFKSGLVSKMHERIDPAVATFDEIRQISQNMPVSERAKQSVMRNISEIPEVRLTGANGKAGEYLGMIERAKSADDLTRISSMISQDSRAAIGSEKHLLGLINEKVRRLSDNSTMRAAVQVAKEGGMRESSGKKIGSEIVQELRDARGLYRQSAEDLNSISSGARIKFKGPQTFADDLDSIPSEEIQKRFFNTKDISQINSLKEKFPEQFDLLRKGELGRISEKSKSYALGGRGETDSGKFLNEYRKLSPEAQRTLIGDSVNTVEDIQTVYSNFPKNFNPSGTASQLGWQDAIGANIKDAGKFLYYKGASSNLAQNLSKAAADKAAQLPQSRAIEQGARRIAAPVSGSSIVASSSVPTKGPERWVQDGADRLEQAGVPAEVLEQFRASPYGREILIEASDASPGSVRMKAVLEKIRTAQGGQ